MKLLCERCKRIIPEQIANEHARNAHHTAPEMVDYSPIPPDPEPEW